VTNNSLGTSFRVNEDSGYVYNITVNNTDAGQTANITRVNVTFWGNFIFTSNSNGTNAANVSFTNTSTVLSWTNTTAYVINGSEWKYFWFNLTAATPGVYNITVTNVNATGADSPGTNLTVTVNDVTPPYYIDFVSPTPVAYANLSQTSIPVNISVNDSYSNIDTIRIYLYNTTGLVNNTNVSAVGGMNATGFINFTGLSEGIYYINSTANDSAGIENLTGPTRTITLDTTKPLIDFGSGMSASGSYVNRNWIYVNVTATDTYFKNVTFYLYNSSNVINRTNSSTSTTFNWTGLADGIYFFNATAYDYSGNSNSTSTTGNLTVDATYPLISNGTGTTADNTNQTLTWIYFNISVTETNEASITFSLFNTTGQYNITTLGAGNRTINWTGLPDGVYTYNATVTDLAGLSNTTATRTARVDTTAPAVNVTSPGTDLDHSTTFLVNTYYVFNFTGTLVFNISSIDTTTSASSCWMNLNNGANHTMTKAGDYFNYTNSSIADGNYRATYYCNDSKNNINGSVTTNFTIDTVKPAISLVSPENGSTSTSNSVSFIFNVTDNNLNAGVADCNLYIDDGDTGFLDVTDISSGTNTSVFTGIINGLHNWTVECWDDAANYNVSTGFFTVSYTAPVTGASSGGGGGSSSTSVTTYNATESQLIPGFTKDLATTARIQFTYGGTSHTLTMNSVSASQITVTVASTPQKKTIALGTSALFDINGDNVNDISVKYVSFANNKATITIQKISTTPTSTTPTNPTPSTPSTSEPSPTPVVTEPIVKKPDFIGPLIIIIIVLLIGITAYMVVRNSHKKKIRHMHSIHHSSRNPYHEQVY